MLTKTEFEAVNTKEALNDLHINGDEKSEFTAKSDANFSPVYFIAIDDVIIRIVEMTGLTFKAGQNKAFFQERH
jgi:hypothetical protein